MNFLFATDRELEMIQLKKRKLHDILLYNKQQIQRKSQERYNQNRQNLHSYRVVNMNTLDVLSEQNSIKNKRKQVERNLLRETYQRQIKEKEERMKQQKIKDREFYQRQRAYSDFDEMRRLADVQKMFDRQTFIATPLSSHKRAKTYAFQQQKQFHNPESAPFHLPSINHKKYDTLQNRRSQQLKQNKGEILGNQKSLDNIYIQTFSKPKSFKK